MKPGTIFAALAILCLITGCPKKTNTRKIDGRNPHFLKVVIADKVIEGKQSSATATWEGGSEPFTITWNFRETIGERAVRRGPCRHRRSSTHQRDGFPASSLRRNRRPARRRHPQPSGSVQPSACNDQLHVQIHRDRPAHVE